MSTSPLQRELLVGVMAAKLGFLRTDKLVDAWASCTKRPGATLMGELMERGLLTPDQVEAARAPSEKLVETHDGDISATLDELSLEIGLAPRWYQNDPEVPSTHVDARAETASRTLLDDRTAPLPPSEFQETPGARDGKASLRGSRFQIEKLLAKGGLGKVSVALDLDLDRKVALKEIREEHAGDRTRQGQFVLEAEVTGKLEHPGIVPVYGLGRDDRDHPYYAMRLIAGVSLKEAIDEFHKSAEFKKDPTKRALQLRELLGRFLDVCDAIAYAHSRGILHRDLKPGNIMLGPFGETLVVDWGLARQFQVHEARATTSTVAETGDPATSAPPGPLELKALRDRDRQETLSGAAVGTPAYMSPEQAEGHSDRLGPASDVYGLGATLYSILTGRAPVKESSIPLVLEKVKKGEIVPPREADPRVVPALDAICQKAMALEPRDRYASARALADDLKRWLADEPVVAYPEPPLVRLGRWTRRYRLAVSIGAVLAVTLAVALGFIAIRERQANVLLKAEQARSESRFKLARKAIESFHTEASREFLLRQPGFQEVRNELLGSAIEFYQQLATELKADPRANEADILELGLTYHDLARLTSDIGKKEQAAETMRLAAATFEPLLGQSETMGPERLLATSLDHLGLLQHELGEDAIARKTMDRSISLRRQVVARFPKDDFAIRQLAEGIANHCTILNDTEPQPETLRLLDEARELVTGVLRRGTNERRDALTTMAVIENNRAIHLAQLDQMAEARDAFSAAAQSLYEMFKPEGSDIDLAAQLANTIYNVALCVSYLGQHDAALKNLDESIRLLNVVVGVYPNLLSYQGQLAKVLTQRGIEENYLDRPEDARRDFERAVQIQRGLLRQDDTSFEQQSQLARPLYFLGYLHRKAGRLKEARAALNESISINQALVDKLPGQVAIVSDLADAQTELARVARKEGHEDEALTLLRKSVEQHRAIGSFEGMSAYNLAVDLAQLAPLVPEDEAGAVRIEAIDAFRKATESEWRFPPSTIKELDEDFASLLDDPKFQSLADLARRKARERELEPGPPTPRVNLAPPR